MRQLQATVRATPVPIAAPTADLFMPNLYARPAIIRIWNEGGAFPSSPITFGTMLADNSTGAKLEDTYIQVTTDADIDGNKSFHFYMDGHWLRFNVPAGGTGQLYVVVAPLFSAA